MCIEVADYNREMARKRKVRERARGQTVPAPKWWLDALDLLDVNNHELAAAVQRVTGVEISVDRIGRVRRGEVVTLDAIEAISKTLALPSPIVFTASLEEAQAIETARRVEAAVAKLPVIASGVPRSTGDGQPAVVEQEHAAPTGGGGKRSRRGMERDRASTSRG